MSQAWQMVTCKDCGKHYRCTPQQDYYNATTTEDGVCETCLLTAANIHPDRVIAAPCPGCGAPYDYPPAGPCENHGTSEARPACSTRPARSVPRRRSAMTDPVLDERAIEAAARAAAATFGYEWVFERDADGEMYDAAYWRHEAAKAVTAYLRALPVEELVERVADVVGPRIDIRCGPSAQRVRGVADRT